MKTGKNRNSTVMCERICRRCGKKFIGGPRAWYCLECKSGRCKEQKLRYTQNKRAGKSIVIGKTIRKCERCGAEFIMMSARQRYCLKCRDEAVKSSDRQQGLEYYKQNRDLINLKRNKTRKMQRKKWLSLTTKGTKHLFFMFRDVFFVYNYNHLQKRK